jgi:integrase/recombinase XerD
VAELADAEDLKSSGRNTLWVQVPPAPLECRAYGDLADFTVYMVVLRKKKETTMKQNTLHTQRTIAVFSQETDLLTWIEAFLLDRKVQNLSKGTLEFYQNKLKHFVNYCGAQVISDITQITPNNLRQFLLHLEETEHNPGGVHAIFRAVKAFMRWYENEVEPENWHNPINKVKSPKVPVEPLDPVDLRDISGMVSTCRKGNFTGERDKAILLVLLDTGARAQEFLDLNISDINIITGEILIRQGKGRKPRTVYLGSRSRKVVRNYMKQRTDNDNALWIRDDGGGRLSYDGLRGIITRRAKQAKIITPSLHAFRRTFALECLRAGVDVFSLQKLMGHADLQVLRRYLAQTTDDIAQAHRIGSPVDNNRK